LAYFKDLEGSDNGVLRSNASAYEIRVAPDDELIITVTSSVPEATAAYNMPLNNPAKRTNYVTATNNAVLQTYIVDGSGDIILPVLGRYHAGGKTTKEISAELTQQVSAKVKDPYVRVELSNFYVNVMGEVEEPQRVAVTSKRFSLLDALAACGDLTEYGRRDRVYVIREEDGQKTYHRMDLADSKIFGSPYFYLKQNDVVYVEPNQIRVDNSRYNQHNAYKLTVISTIVSAASVVASLVIALTVK